MLVISFHDAVLRKAQRMIDIMMRARDGRQKRGCPGRDSEKERITLKEISGAWGLWLGLNV